MDSDGTLGTMIIRKEVAKTATSGLSHRLAPWLILIAITFLPACSRLTLPAIDPNGQSIFLPPPNYTQLQLPRLHNGENFLPDAAYERPPTPPPCIDGRSGGVCNLFDRKCNLAETLRNSKPGKAGELQLTPPLIVAPVDGEVTLLAGVCGKDGYFVTRQPIEWMLSPDSVGTFIDVGDDAPSKLARLFRHNDPVVEKLDVDFARGRTSAKPSVITKGSPQCTDDIHVKEGQTWLSISSPSEGVSRITALAPDSEIWDQRRQTATIYWVDAQWDFPPVPPPAPRGQPVDLVTRVTRAENFIPAVGWIVKYTLSDPSVARFVTNPPSDGAVVAVPVNQDGQAPVRLVAGPTGRGTTQVLIDVYRPASEKDNLPELRLGGGQTLVTFTAPVLVVEAIGPDKASPGQELSYVASLGNAGDVDIANSALTARIPEGWTLARTPTPEPTTTTPTYLIWEQGILPAGQQLDVQVDMVAGRANSYQVIFQGRGEPNLTAEKTLPVEVVASSVEARFAPRGGVSQAEIGDAVVGEIEVTNTGPTALSNVTLLVEATPGLVEPTRQKSEVELKIPVLQPNETRSVLIDLQVQREGELGATLKVIANRTVLVQRELSVIGIRPRAKRPDIGISVEFPSSFAVGDKPTALIRLENPGETPLTDIKVTIDIPPGLEARQVDTINFSNFRVQNNVATWRPFDLLPSPDANAGIPFRLLRLQLECLGPTERGQLQISATSKEGITRTTTADFRATGQAVLPPGASNTPTRQGNWKVSIRDSDDPVIVGRPMDYYLVVENQQNLADSEVVIRLAKPAGVDVRSISLDGRNVPIRVSPNDPRIIDLPIVNYVRPGGILYYTITVVPTVVTDSLRMRATVTSRSQPPPGVSAEQSTTVTN
ncbi:MAG: FAM174 family membrane protein [Aureliella sp.]